MIVDDHDDLDRISYFHRWGGCDQTDGQPSPQPGYRASGERFLIIPAGGECLVAHGNLFECVRLVAAIAFKCVIAPPQDAYREGLAFTGGQGGG